MGEHSDIRFTIGLERDQDWYAGMGAWRFPALRIPGLVVEHVYVGGNRVDSRVWQVDEGQQVLHWNHDPPDRALVAVYLSEGLAKASDTAAAGAEAEKWKTAAERWKAITAACGVVGALAAATGAIYKAWVPTTNGAPTPSLEAASAARTATSVSTQAANPSMMPAASDGAVAPVSAAFGTLDAASRLSSVHQGARQAPPIDCKCAIDAIVVSEGSEAPLRCNVTAPRALTITVSGTVQPRDPTTGGDLNRQKQVQVMFNGLGESRSWNARWLLGENPPPMSLVLRGTYDPGKPPVISLPTCRWYTSTSCAVSLSASCDL